MNFGNYCRRSDQFPPLIINARLLEAGILLSPKMVILENSLKGWAFIRAWTFIRYFTVSYLHTYATFWDIAARSVSNLFSLFFVYL